MSQYKKVSIKYEDERFWVGFESVTDLSSVLVDGGIIDEIEPEDKPSEKIKEHLERSYMYINEDRWNNTAVLGYLKHALKHTDMADGNFDKLLYTIQQSFDQMTVDEAEDFFKNSKRGDEG